MEQILTIRLRVRDKHAAELQRQARTVNFVWNYCNEIQKKARDSQRRWPSAYDLCNLTSGSAKELNIAATTIQQICFTYVKSREINHKAWLRWRSKKSL